jgi:hypothetical protein
LQNGNCMILCCDIAEVLRPTREAISLVLPLTFPSAHYFSTQGCSLLFSLTIGAFDVDAPFAAAASLRALMSKKLAIVVGELDLGPKLRFFNF